ncbi:MAG: hypothetical protein IJ572_04785 [Bacilli bacterium]|nr:hypothetical protein [Bacilli bacterium]
MKKNNFISIAFVFIIFFVFIWTIVKQGLITLHIISFDKTDNWQVVEATGDKIYDKIKSFEVGIENRVNNYFPNYIGINDLFYTSIMKIDSLYLNDIYLKNNRDNEKVFFNKTKNFYYIVNNYSEKELDNKMNDQISFFNELSNKYNNVSFNIYMPLRYEINSFVNIKNLNDKYNYFKSKINKNINIKALESNNTDEYLNYFYKTDHHYNSYGAKKAYDDILDMFNIIDYENYKHKEVIGKYYGSAAKSLLVDNIYDNLSAIDVNNLLNVNISEDRFKPLNVTKKDNKFYDYYVAYYDGQYDEVIYNNTNNNTDNNLLIIGDSLAWQIDYLLAGHFNNTHVINLRYGKWLKNNLDLNSYIKDNKITHILFLQEAEEEMFDIYNFNLKERVN